MGTFKQHILQLTVQSNWLWCKTITDWWPVQIFYWSDAFPINSQPNTVK